MNALTKTVQSFLSQDVARLNAATATGRVMRERQERAEVAAYLAQVDPGRPRVPDRHAHRSPARPDQAMEV